MTIPTHTINRLTQQLQFVVEIDKLKHILRKTRIIADPALGESRFENSAEHSWHIALIAIVLAEHSNAPIDLPRVLKMLLIHDVVEIDAGDTFAFGDQSNKASSEQAAADRLFGLLPDDQRAEFRALWDEFEARQSTESRYANAIDRLMPVFQNMRNQGGSWAEHTVTRAQVDKRLSPIGEGSTVLWGAVKEQLEVALALGFLQS